MPSPVDLTRQLVQLDTTNPGSNEREAARLLAGILGDAGFAIEFHEFAEARTSLVASWGDGDADRSIAFTGHLDTVPLGRAEWSQDPFSARIVEDRLYGRGASDMKAGVAAFVCAAVEFAEHADRSARLTLVITAGEETGCDGATHLRDAGALPGAAALVVAEPTSNRPLVGHKGALWLNLVTAGVTGHGSMPHTGVNAIYRAADVVFALKSMDLGQAPDALFGSPTVNVGTIRGGLNVNSIPDRVEIGVDFRTIPGMSHAELRERLWSDLAPDLEELSTLVDLEPVSTSADDDWVGGVFDICSDHLGGRPEPASVAYFTDASILQRAYGGVPTVILGPGEAELAHQTDEYCHVSRIEQACAIYRDVLQRWAGT